MVKKNFKVGQRVVVDNMPQTEEIFGKSGEIIGRSYSDGEIDFYIILLDTALIDGTKGISLIESCIKAS